MSATLVILLCALMCPLVMGAMMLLMRRDHAAGHRARKDDSDEPAE